MPVPIDSLTKRIDQFLEKRPRAPCVVIDLDIVRAKYGALQKLWPKANIYYAVKANPAPKIISALAELGANFDLASPGEIDLCFGLSIPSERLSFGNTIKRESAIAKSWTDGIRLFAFDSTAELEKLARCAVGSRVFCRMLLPENCGGDQFDAAQPGSGAVL
jgi:ornithine decarboxylase